MAIMTVIMLTLRPVTTSPSRSSCSPSSSPCHCHHDTRCSIRIDWLKAMLTAQQYDACICISVSDTCMYIRMHSLHTYALLMYGLMSSFRTSQSASHSPRFYLIACVVVHMLIHKFVCLRMSERAVDRQLQYMPDYYVITLCIARPLM